jgi:predicted branched-subunit amino acid permease
VGGIVSPAAGCVIGYFLTASLPPLLTAAMLFLTPMSFLISTARNARTLADRSALALGLIILPLLVYADVGLDLMWTGIIAGTAAYGIHRWRRGRP